MRKIEIGDNLSEVLIVLIIVLALIFAALEI